MDFALNAFLRRWAAGFALTALTVALAACGSDDDNNTGESRVGSLKLIGTASIPTGTLFDGVEFSGISGLDQATDSSYWAISDDRGGERGTPRFFNLSIDCAATGLVTVKVNRQTYMQRWTPRRSAWRPMATCTGRPRATGAQRLRPCSSPSCGR
jgi:hypothetical protein